MKSNPVHPARRRWGGRVLVIALVAIVGLTIAGIVWGVGKLGLADAQTETPVEDGQPASEWFEAEPRSFDLIVHASGELEAKSKVDVRSEVEGTNTIIELVPEGKSVKKGDILVKLADDELLLEIEEADLKLEAAKADETADDQALSIAISEAKSAEEAADLKETMAKLALEKWVNGTDPQKKKELDQALELAKRTLTRVERDYKLSEDLFKAEFISLNEKEDALEAVLKAKDALEKAVLDKKVYLDYTRPSEKQQAESDLSQATAELERTRRKNESQLAQARAKLDASRRTLKIREERLEKLNAQLDLTTIRAPRDGLVVYSTSSGSSRYRHESIEEGREVRYNEVLIVLPDTSHMIAVIKVHEAVVRQIREGQKVSISIDARQGKPIEGKVVSKGVMAVDSGWGSNPDLREYEVKVELPPSADGELKPSMRCRGQIHLGSVDNKLAVPIQAVHTRDRERFCYVDIGNGKVKRVAVKIGRSSEEWVEIKSGLETGSRILMRRPRPDEVMED